MLFFIYFVRFILDLGWWALTALHVPLISYLPGHVPMFGAPALDPPVFNISLAPFDVARVGVNTSQADSSMALFLPPLVLVPDVVSEDTGPLCTSIQLYDPIPLATTFSTAPQVTLDILASTVVPKPSPVVAAFIDRWLSAIYIAVPQATSTDVIVYKPNIADDIPSSLTCPMHTDLVVYGSIPTSLSTDVVAFNSIPTGMSTHIQATLPSVPMLAVPSVSTDLVLYGSIPTSLVVYGSQADTSVESVSTSPFMPSALAVCPSPSYVMPSTHVPSIASASTALAIYEPASANQVDGVHVVSPTALAVVDPVVTDLLVVFQSNLAATYEVDIASDIASVDSAVPMIETSTIAVGLKSSAPTPNATHSGPAEDDILRIFDTASSAAKPIVRNTKATFYHSLFPYVIACVVAILFVILIWLSLKWIWMTSTAAPPRTLDTGFVSSPGARAPLGYASSPEIGLITSHNSHDDTGLSSCIMTSSTSIPAIGISSAQMNDVSLKTADPLSDDGAFLDDSPYFTSIVEDPPTITQLNASAPVVVNLDLLNDDNIRINEAVAASEATAHVQDIDIALRTPLPEDDGDDDLAEESDTSPAVVADVPTGSVDNLSSISISTVSTVDSLPLNDSGCLIVEEITEELAASLGLPSPPKKRNVPRGGRRRSAQLRRQTANDMQKFREELLMSGVPLPPFSAPVIPPPRRTPSPPHVFQPLRPTKPSQIPQPPRFKQPSQVSHPLQLPQPVKHAQHPRQHSPLQRPPYFQHTQRPVECASPSVDWRHEVLSERAEGQSGPKPNGARGYTSGSRGWYQADSRSGVSPEPVSPTHKQSGIQQPFEAGPSGVAASRWAPGSGGWGSEIREAPRPPIGERENVRPFGVGSDGIAASRWAPGNSGPGSGSRDGGRRTPPRQATHQRA